MAFYGLNFWVLHSPHNFLADSLWEIVFNAAPMLAHLLTIRQSLSGAIRRSYLIAFCASLHSRFLSYYWKKLPSPASKYPCVLWNIKKPWFSCLLFSTKCVPNPNCIVALFLNGTAPERFCGGSTHSITRHIKSPGGSTRIKLFRIRSAADSFAVFRIANE